MKLATHFPFFFAIVFLLTVVSCNDRHNDLGTPYYACLDAADSAKATYDYQKAFGHYYRSLGYTNDTTPRWKAYSSIEMAKIQTRFGDYAGADSLLTQTLSYLKDTLYRSNVYAALGNNFSEQHDYVNARHYMERALALKTDAKDQLLLRNNIGYLYLQAQDYPRALSYYSKLIQTPGLDTIPDCYAKIRDNQAAAGLYLNHPQTKAWLDRAYRLRDSLGNPLELTASTMHYAAYYLRQGQRDSAVIWAQKAYGYATQLHHPEDRLEALRYLIQALPNAKAKEPMEHYLRLSDSMDVVRSKAKVYFTSVIYDANLVRKENERFRSQLQLLLIAAGVLVCVGGVYFINQRLRLRNRILRATYETELRLSKKVHDELANDVFKTLSFVENQTPDSPNKEAVLDHLEEIYQRTRFLSRSTGAIETGLTFKEELLELMAGFSSPTVAVIALNVERIDWNLIATTSKITLYRVLQELLVNMKKHSGANRVQITFETSKHQLVVHYEDNGIGMPTGVSPKNGLVNVENRILTLGGSISFETHQPTGCALKFILPK